MDKKLFFQRDLKKRTFSFIFDIDIFGDLRKTTIFQIDLEKKCMDKKRLIQNFLKKNIVFLDFRRYRGKKQFFKVITTKRLFSGNIDIIGHMDKKLFFQRDLKKSTFSLNNCY